MDEGIEGGSERVEAQRAAGEEDFAEQEGGIAVELADPAVAENQDVRHPAREAFVHGRGGTRDDAQWEEAAGLSEGIAEAGVEGVGGIGREGCEEAAVETDAGWSGVMEHEEGADRGGAGPEGGGFSALEPLGWRESSAGGG